MLSGPLIPAEMVDTGQGTVTLVPAVAGMAPGRGVQAIPMAPISREHMRDAVHIDGQDRQ